jgi:methylmalonyl-CoA/ethylmalonyl-CoA epimerase
MQVDHLGMAVRNLSLTVPRWEKVTGGKASSPEEVPGQGVRVSFLASGPIHLEFLEPLSADSAVGRFLERRGEGMHHIAFEVPNVDAQLAKLKAGGARLVDERGRVGARGRRIGFAHPSAFDGVLVEFVEALR